MPALFESGVFGSNTPFWHREGRVVEGTFSLDEAMQWGDLDWTVEKRPVFIKDNRGNDIVVPDAYAITRIRDNKPLGKPVGPEYQPIQNRKAFSVAESVLADKTCRWDTAISIRGGATIAGVISLLDSEVEILKGDKHFLYLGLVNTHDGNGRMKVFPTDTRMGCANTVQVALNGRDKDLTISVRHSGNVDSKVDQMRDIISVARSDYLQFAEWQRELAHTNAPRNRVEELMNALFPEPEDPTSKRAKTMRDNKIAGLLEAVHVERNLLPQWTLTGGGDQSAYLWLNGITHWVDHTVGNRKDDRAEYVMLGGGKDFKTKAVNLVADIFGVPLPKARN